MWHLERQISSTARMMGAEMPEIAYIDTVGKSEYPSGTSARIQKYQVLTFLQKKGVDDMKCDKSDKWKKT